LNKIALLSAFFIFMGHSVMSYAGTSCQEVITKGILGEGGKGPLGILANDRLGQEVLTQAISDVDGQRLVSFASDRHHELKATKLSEENHHEIQVAKEGGQYKVFLSRPEPGSLLSFQRWDLGINFVLDLKFEGDNCVIKEIKVWETQKKHPNLILTPEFCEKAQAAAHLDIQIPKGKMNKNWMSDTGNRLADQYSDFIKKDMREVILRKSDDLPRRLEACNQIKKYFRTKMQKPSAMPIFPSESENKPQNTGM
jgi:hypothetical protein